MGRMSSEPPPDQASWEGPEVVAGSFDPDYEAAHIQLKRKTEVTEEPGPSSDQQPPLRRSKRVRSSTGHAPQQTESATLQSLQTFRLTKPIARPSPRHKPSTMEVLDKAAAPNQPNTPGLSMVQKIELLPTPSPSCCRLYGSAAVLPPSAHGSPTLANSTSTEDVFFAAPQQNTIYPPAGTRLRDDPEPVPLDAPEIPGPDIPFSADLFNELLPSSYACHDPNGALMLEEAVCHGLDEKQDTLLLEASVGEERTPMANSTPSQPSLSSRVLNITYHEDPQGTLIDDHDQYDIDPATEEDMLKLLEPEPTTLMPLIQPSTMTRGMDPDSSVEAFDPTLQFSSPKAAALPENGSHEQKESDAMKEEDLLGSDVDWDEAMTAVTHPVAETSSQDIHLQSGETAVEQPTTYGDNMELVNTTRYYPTQASTVLAAGNGAVQAMDGLSLSPLGAHTHMHEECVPYVAPFARPPFPEKARRSPVVGLSSAVVMRTCFRIGELLNEGARRLKQAAQPTSSTAPDSSEVLFELFAVVTYSNRESGSSRIQHFQFRDLFKDQLPYPTGTLQGWKPNSLLDRQSRAFLGGAARMKMCRCICKLRREKKSGTGWHITVLAIRETDWDEIAFLKRIICPE